MLEIERHDAVCVLRMRAPENRFDAELLGALEAALDELEARPGPLALVTTGNGRFYSNGLDLEWLARGGADDPAAFLARVQRLWARLLVFPAPTLAAIDGHAFAGGAMLALAHDERLMRGDRGWLCVNEIELATGRPITRGMSALLACRLAPATLHELVLTGRRYAGPDAAAAGIVREACAAQELLPRAIARAAQLAGKHRPTLAALKRRLFEPVVAALEAPDVFA